jgi:hypothetical protein
VCPVGQGVQQHCLVHARIAVHHQHPALTDPGRGGQPVERVPLAVEYGQPRRAAGPLRSQVWIHPSILADGK